jgi:flagellar L-ring protein precursor FlgH
MLNINQNRFLPVKLTLSIKLITLFAVVSFMNACAITPSTIVNTPTTAKPIAPKLPSASSGAIYTASSHRALFEDRRARMIGDILTINITESTTANKAGSSASSKSGSVESSASIPVGLPIDLIKEGISIAADSSIDNDDSATENASNRFNGNITVTVVDVLANGYLMISGEKQIALDKGTEFVRFSGVVNPDNITLGNEVLSTKVADARVEYRTNSKMDAAQIASVFARFFLSFSPI